MNAAHWLEAAGAFLLALLWSAVAMPWAIGLGRRTGMVARPRLFGRHRRQVISLLGGAGLAGAATAAFLLAGGPSREAGAILAGGAALLALGTLDDRRAGGGLAPATRLAVESGVAVVAWWAGLRLDVVGVEWADALVTVFFLVAATNAFNLLDNMDGVAGSTAAALAAVLLLLAAAGGQHLVATLAAALLGASLGFLRHNLVRARVYLGNGGALFLGFLLAAAALQLRLPFGPPWGPAALAALFVVPAADTSLVIASRLLGGRPIFRGGTDHTSHRLIRLGLPQRLVPAVHALGSLAGAGAVVAAAESGRPKLLLGAIGAGGATVAALLAVRVYEREPRTRSRLRRVAPALAGIAVAATAPALAAGLSAAGDLRAGSEALLAARTAMRELDPERAGAALHRAEAALRRAGDRLGSWATAPARLVPGVRGNLQTAEALADAGLLMAGAGREALRMSDALPREGGRLAAPWRGGAVALERFRTAAGPARRVVRLAAEAEGRLRGAGGVLLLPEVRAAREEALRSLAEARRQAERAEAAALLVPRLLGDGGPRTWLLGAENTAELRGRGGYLGALGVVEAEGGRVSLGRFLPVSDLPPLAGIPAGDQVPAEYRAHYRRIGGLAAWPNLTMSPHFPSGARLLLSSLPGAGGPEAGGVVAIDPTALGFLLEATGPVRIPGVPEPIGAANVVEWTLNRAYFDFDSVVRKGHLAAVMQAVWQRLVSGGDVEPARLLDALGRGLAGRHIVVYSADPAEQALIERLGIGGAVDRTPGDYLMVVGQNVGENKMDYYLARDLSYRAEVAVDGSMRAALDVRVRNTAPAGEALPDEVGGRRGRLGLEPGEARSYLSALVPARAVLEEVLVDGRPTTDFDSRRELGKRVISTYVQVGPGESRTVSLRYRIPGILLGDRYRLVVQNQATVVPDRLTVRVRVPPDSVVREREGFVPEQTLAWSGTLESARDLSALLRVPMPARIAARVASLLRRPVQPVPAPVGGP